MSLNWIIVGSGDVVNRLVKKSFNLRNSRVLYVYSDDYNQAKKIVKKYDYGKVIKNIEIAIKDKRINCAYIATPPNNKIFLKLIYFMLKRKKPVKKYIIFTKHLYAVIAREIEKKNYMKDIIIIIINQKLFTNFLQKNVQKIFLIVMMV